MKICKKKKGNIMENFLMKIDKMENKKQQEPKIMKSSVTDEYYYVDKYKDLGNGNFLSLSKRKATKEEIKEFKKWK